MVLWTATGIAINATRWCSAPSVWRPFEKESMIRRVMDITTFVSIGWLAEDDGLSYEATQARLDVGAELGLERQWYKDEAGLRKLFEQVNPTNPALFDEITYADTLDARSAWILKLAEAMHPKEPAAAALSAKEAAAEATVALAHLVDDIDESEAKELIAETDLDPVKLAEFVKDESFLEGFEKEMAEWDVDKLLSEIEAGGDDAAEGDEEESE
jgi:hypothetical protein